MNNKYEKYSLFASAIADKYIDKITGASNDKIIGVKPSRKIFAGKLMVENSQENSYSSKINLNVKSLEFIVDKKTLTNGNIEIDVSGDLYYRDIPSLKVQQESYLKTFNEENSVKYSLDEMFDAYRSNISKARKLFFPSVRITDVFSKYRFKPKTVKIELKEFLEKKEYKKNYSDDIEILSEKILAKDGSYYKINQKITIDEIIDSINYKRFLDLHVSNLDEKKCYPTWHFELDCSLDELDNGKYIISIRLINSTESNNVNTYLSNLIFDSTLYNSNICTKLNNGNFDEIELDHFKRNYKYSDIKNYSQSNSTSIYFNEAENTLTTENVPRFLQKRVKTNDKYKIKFDDLIKNPIESLIYIKKEMEKELRIWEKEYSMNKSSLVKDRQSLGNAQEQYKSELENFENEINRFTYGIQLLEKYHSLRRAFILMNKTFKENAKTYDSWRLFQIIFIVLQIPDVAVSEFSSKVINKTQIDNVDLLYFPTGGGKTEAFLGISIFTLFFDRIRGKKYGNSVIIKYPLRLLSVQQLDRLMKILVIAEKLRNEDKMSMQGQEFSLGYYVGGKNTPNRIQGKKMQYLMQMSNESLENEYKIIDRCPLCKMEVTLKLDKENRSLKHYCTNKECQIDILPLYIVDSDIYSKVPSIIIGTIDKIAAIGYNKRFQKILGNIKYQCIEHGFYNSPKCPICNNSNLLSVDDSKLAPTLFIQDEVHLLNESLGVYASHYEKFLDWYIKTFKNKKVKHLAATATVSGANEHLLHLYAKGSNLFPSETPYRNKNFYAFEDENELSRIIIGHTSYGIAYDTTVVYALEYLREIICEYRNDFNRIRSIKGLEKVSDELINEMLEYYWMIIQYNNTKIDTNKITRAIESVINFELDEMNFPIFRCVKMTGDDSFQEVRNVLENIENTKDVFSSDDLLVATSTISHGVDIDRANLMVFNGMPKHNSEYVQAYSRVGRKYPGVVIDIIRSSRNKDMSYLKNFNNFHELKDILIENVPINTWALNAIESTLPGVISGIIINHYSNSYKNVYMMDSLKEAFESNKITKSKIKEYANEIYKTNHKDGKFYKRFLNKTIDDFFDEIGKSNFNSIYITSGFEELDTLNKPMFSLRETGKQVNIGVE